MANLDRPGIVELLGRLGAEDDATALAAARELNAKVSQSGLTWDQLLRADLDTAGAETEHEDAPRDETEEPAEEAGELSAADKAEALRLIDRLLARKGVRARCARTSPSSSAASPTAASTRWTAAMSARSPNVSASDAAAAGWSLERKRACPMQRVATGFHHFGGTKPRSPIVTMPP